MTDKMVADSAGKGMAVGAGIAAFIALVVQFSTGDANVWTWVVPVGIAIGLAIGLASTRKPNSPE